MISHIQRVTGKSWVPRLRWLAMRCDADLDCRTGLIRRSFSGKFPNVFISVISTEIFWNSEAIHSPIASVLLRSFKDSLSFAHDSQLPVLLDAIQRGQTPFSRHRQTDGQTQQSLWFQSPIEKNVPQSYLFSAWIHRKTMQSREHYFILSDISFDHAYQFQTRLPVYISNLLTGASSWNTAHLIQSIRLGSVKKFDYGDPEKNKLKYGSSVPPDYDLGSINSTNIALIYTANDYLNHLQDVQRLKDGLQGNRGS